MHGDYSLNPFAYRDHVSRVLYQQGRVQLDSDMNELTESMLRAMRALAYDTIGPHGGPGESFKITRAGEKFFLNAGHYWVDGIRCTNPPRADYRCELFEPGTGRPASTPLSAQPFPPAEEEQPNAAGLFYLDVFEHQVSPAQDESLREAALLGADTTNRALVVWQVKKLSTAETASWRNLLEQFAKEPPGHCDPAYLALNLLLRPRPRLRARATLPETNDACVISPDARYRGAENRLFRVEIHDGATPSFKFSRDNGAETYSIRKMNGAVVHVESLGRDQRTAIRVNDWVEVVDDEVLLTNRALPLRQVIEVRRHDMTVVLDREPEENAGTNPALHPILRRWAGNARKFTPGTNWIDVGDGVQVQLTLAPGTGRPFRPGDYWLIPTRTTTGDVIWPRDKDKKKTPLPLPPHGVDHHYAPLEDWNGTNAFTPHRMEFRALTRQT